MRAEKPPRTSRTPVNENRGQKKARTRQYTQSYFEKSPARCIKAIMDETLFSEETIPRGDLNIFWRDIFTKEPIGIQECITELKPEIESISQLISTSEVKDAVRQLKQNAPGLDGIKSDLIKGVQVSQLRVLFNLFLSTEYTPRWLRMGTVTLIPKIANPTSPGEYRPITVISQLIRCYHGILARRMLVLPLSPRQKAFLPRDGIAENVWILYNIIQQAKREFRELHVIFMDVAKAFDSLAHSSLIQAAERIGIPRTVRNYLKLMYDEAEMTLKGSSEVIRQRNGIRQGEPTSGPGFDSAIDMGFEKLDERLGFYIKPNIPVTNLLFADDGVATSETRGGLKIQVETIVTEMGKMGFKMNSKKCETLSVVVNKKKRFTAISENSFIKIDGADVPAMKVGDVYKYLGLRIGASGFRIQDLTIDLLRKLDLLSTANLKPQQRLYALRIVVIPGLTHQLVLSGCWKKVLRNLDITIRRYTRRWLHLPRDVPVAMFHAAVQDGGLGIPSLEFRICRLRRTRYIKMMGSDDPVVQAYLEMESNAGLLARFTKVLRLGDVDIIDKASEGRAWKEKLNGTVDGRGLSQHSESPSWVNSWLTDPLYKICGRDFVKAVHVRCGCLKTPSRAARGNRGDPHCKSDRQIANSNHIYQVCQLTHGLRVGRHDTFVKKIRSSVNRIGYRSLMEPRIPVGQSFVKPDLIIWKGDRVYVIDPIISNDVVSLELRAQEKTAIYGIDPVKNFALDQARPPGDTDWGGIIKVTGITVNNRGAISTTSCKVLKEIGIGPVYINYMLVRCLTDTWRMLHAYNSSTR